MAILHKCPRCGRVWMVEDCFNYSRSGVVYELCFDCLKKEIEETRKLIEKMLEEVGNG